MIKVKVGMKVNWHSSDTFNIGDYKMRSGHGAKLLRRGDTYKGRVYGTVVKVLKTVAHVIPDRSVDIAGDLKICKVSIHHLYDQWLGREVCWSDDWDLGAWWLRKYNAPGTTTGIIIKMFKNSAHVVSDKDGTRHTVSLYKLMTKRYPDHSNVYAIR